MQKTLKKMKQVCKLFIFFTIAIVILFTVKKNYCNAKSADVEKKIVKIAWYLIPGFQDYDKQGNPCGYAFEYLEKMAEYRNWKITYVPASYSEACQMLSSGQVNFMFANPRDQRDDQYIYSDKSPASFGLRFVTLRSNQKTAFQDYIGYEGMRVGIVRNTDLKLETLSYMQGKGVHITLIEYESTAELEAALKDLKIDGIVLAPLEDGSEYRLLDEFSFRTLNFITKATDIKFMEEINRAMDNLERYQVGFVNRLYQQYYGNEHEGSLILSRQESLFVKQNPVVDVYVGPDWYPVIYKDEVKEGKRKGVLFDFLEYLTDQTGLRFRIIYYDNYAQIFDTQGYRLNQSVSLTNMSASEAKNYKLQLTDNFLNTTIYSVRNDSQSDSKTKDVIALPIGVYYQPELLKNWKSHEIIYYQSMEECLNALMIGNATTTFVNSYEQAYYLEKSQYKNLKSNILPIYETSFCFSVSWASSIEIKSIIEKGLLSIPKGEWNRIIEENTNYQTTESVSSVLEKNINWVLAGFIILLGFSICIFTLFLRLNKQKQILTEETEQSKQLFKMIRKNLWEIKLILQATRDWSTELLVYHSNGKANRIIQQIGIVNEQAKELVVETEKILDIKEISNEMVPVYEQSVFSYLMLLIRQDAAKKNIQVISLFQTQNYFPIYMNQRIVIQALLHLLQNAIKFSGRNSIIEFLVHSQINETDGRICHIYEIIDHGVGMSPKKLEELFAENRKDVYESEEEHYLKRLAQTKKDIEEAGGQILCESIIGKGTTFTVTMNYRRAEVLEVDSENEKNQVEQINKKIIVASENAFERLQIAEQLERYGILVEHAEDGQQVIEKYIQSKLDFYDVMLLYLDLPNMNGVETAKEIRCLRRNDAIAVKLFGVYDPLENDTGKRLMDQMEQEKDSPFDQIFEKPFDVKKIIEMMK